MEIWSGHYVGGGSDKVYVIVKKEIDFDKYEVFALWGRRRGTLQKASKGRGRSDYCDSIVQKLRQSKVKKGYEGASYIQQDSNVKYEISRILVGSKPVSPNPTPPARGFKPDDIVVCENNLGLEESFDAGIEYIVASVAGDGMISVYDRFGVAVECGEGRFTKAD